MIHRINKLLYFKIIWIFYYLIDSIFIIFKKLKNKKLEVDNNKIAVVKVDRIGDFILWINAAQSLRKNTKDQS